MPPGHPSGHVVLIEDSGPDGFGVRCIPHGSLGSHPTHLAAFIAAAEHDDQISPWAEKGWS